MYRHGPSAFGDIVIPSKEGVVVPHESGIVVNDDSEADIVVTSGSEGYDMLQDQFADIVIGHPEGIAVNSETDASGYDTQQDAFAEIRGGDDGLGIVQARRLKRRIRGRRMRIGGPQVVRIGYSDPLDNSLGRFSFKRMFKHPFGKKSIFGKTTRFVGKNVVPLAAGGLAFFGAKKVMNLLGRKRPGGSPLPAITSPTQPSVPEAPPVDAAGQTLPPDIAARAGTSAAPSSPVGGPAVPTASEQVAAAAEAAGGGQETGDATVTQADVGGGTALGSFTDMLKSPMGIGLAVVAGYLLFTGGGKKRRRR